MRILNLIFVITVLFSSHIYADEITNTFPADLKGNLAFFNKICESNPKHALNNLILIDTTDPLTDDQIQFIRDNYIKNAQWKNLGDKFTIVVLNEKPAALMDFVTMCAPVPESKIDSSMAVLNQKKQIRIFNKTLSDVFDTMVKPKGKAQNTNLIESLVEVFRSKRYGFLDAGERHLIIASDLYQNSTLISFYKLCKKNQCPTFADTVKDKAINNFIRNEAKLSIRSTDKIDIFNLKSQGRVNLTAKPWWVDYLGQAGANKNNLKIQSQL